MNAKWEEKFEEYRSTFDDALKKFCAAEKRKRLIPPTLFEAMTYSLNAGGKRMRPILCMAVAELSGARGIVKKVLPMAILLEIFHTSTLILDDLPCMDDDVLRRGKPACHVVHGTANAMLAGGAMPLWGMEHAMNALLKNKIPAEKILAALKLFVACAGASGVFGGQVIDIDTEEDRPPVDVLKVTSMKTTSLILASVQTGAILAGLPDDEIIAVAHYGYSLGIGFQAVDDILDETATAESLGKTPGKDKKQGKKTFTQVFGMKKTRALTKVVSEQSVEALAPLGERAEFLQNFARALLEREK